MAKTQIYTQEEARKKLKAGVNKLAEVVISTLGPKGKNVILDRGFSNPVITNDGVSIARVIEMEDKAENLGAMVIKDVAIKANDTAGDGTTSSVAIANAIINEGMKMISAGANPMSIKRGLEKCVPFVVKELQDMSKKIKSVEDLTHVATISAENAEMGRTIAELVNQVGNDGVITVEDSHTIGITTETVTGLQVNRGYISQYMITDPDKMEAVINEPYVLVTDERISALKPLMPLLEKIIKSGKKDIVIVADEIDGESLNTLVVNKLKGVINFVGIKSPGYGDKRKAMLKDIAVVTGATVITQEAGYSFDSTTLDMLGSCRTVISKKDKTIFVGGIGKQETIDKHIESIKALISDSKSNYENEFARERIAIITGGIAVLKVGAQTEVEQKALKDKAEDAVNATKAALEEGIVIGSGISLLYASEALKNTSLIAFNKLDSDEEFARSILVNALRKPLFEIAENCGLNGGVIIDKVLSAMNGRGYDFSVNDGELVDMYERGIVDPLKVVRSSFENAVSGSSIMLTTNAIVCEEPKEIKNIDSKQL